MKKIAIDTNIVLDAICNRKDAATAQALFLTVAEEKAVGIITANAITDIYYIARKNIGAEAAREAVQNLMILFDIAAVDGDICSEAVWSDMDDFEDAVFAYAAAREGADCLITRDRGLLESSVCPVTACLPNDILSLLQNEQQRPS